MNIQSNINSAINQVATVAGIYSIAKQKKASEQARQARQAKLEMQFKTRTALKEKQLELQEKQLGLQEKQLGLQERRLSLSESRMIAQSVKKHEKEVKAAGIKLADGTPISALGPAARAQILAQMGGKKNGK